MPSFSPEQLYHNQLISVSMQGKQWNGPQLKSGYVDITFAFTTSMDSNVKVQCKLHPGQKTEAIKSAQTA